MSLCWYNRRLYLTSVGENTHPVRVGAVSQNYTSAPKYTSSDANPHGDAVFSLQVAQDQFSGYAADAGVSQILFIAF